MASDILVTKKANNSEVTVYIGGKHYRKTENVASIYQAANTFRTSGKESDREKLMNLLNPQGNLKRQLFGGGFLGDKGKVFLAGSDTPLPDFLVKMMEEYEQNNWSIQPLANFWTLSLLNPNPQARDEFFDYCMKWGVVITDFGYAVLYKAVKKAGEKTIEHDKDLTRYVAEAAMTVKRKKKGLGRYNVFLNEETKAYTMAERDEPNEGESIVGNLSDLFSRLDDLSTKETMQTYTDKHSSTMEILLGVPVKMDRARCDDNSGVECSRGLHVGAFPYVKNFGKHGDTIMACLVNPMNVVAIPRVDTSKIRVCEYMPRAIMEGGESREWSEIESPYHEDDYLGHEITALKATQGSASTAQRQVIETRLLSLKKDVGNTALVVRDAVEVFEEETSEGKFDFHLVKSEEDFNIVDEDKLYKVAFNGWIDKPGNPVALLKEIRRTTGCGLKEARAMMEAGFGELAKGLTLEQKEEVVNAFTAIGASTDVAHTV